MKAELQGCYTDGHDFSGRIIKSYQYQAKMTQFISMLGVRSADTELEELITMSCNAGSPCKFMLPILIDGTEGDKKTAVKQFIAGYIKGKATRIRAKTEKSGSDK